MEIVNNSHGWYETLIDECRQILTEHVFLSNWTLIEGYWSLGRRIDKDKHRLKRHAVTRIAKDMGKSRRTIERAVQFYKKYPDLNLLPEGKNTSWHRIVNKYLPETSGKTEKKEKKVKCPNCSFEFSPLLTHE